MKNTITLAFLCLSSFLFAQSTLTIFNNGGQQFFVILNGIKQNSIAQTNVSISGISNGSYSVKLIFADGKTKDIDKNFFLEEPSFITTRVVFKKGKGKLQLIGMEPAGNQKPAENMVVYRPSNNAVYSDAPVAQPSNPNAQNGTIQSQVNTNVTSTGTNTVNQQMNMNVGTNVNGDQLGANTSVHVTETQTTNTTSNTNSNPQGENVNINMNVNVQDPTMNGQGGANISINMSGTGTGTQTQQGTYQQTTTVTTTSTQTSSNVGSNQQMNNSNQINTQVNNSNSAAANNSSTVTCKNILGNEKEFIDDLNTMTFDEDKKEIVLKDLANYCLTGAQAYKIVEVFTFEADRLELAKFLYNRMIDKDSAKNLLNLFTFDATKVEFREYIRR